METLVNIASLKPETLFTKDAVIMGKVIEKIKSHVSFSTLDPTTEEGRKEITSLAYKITRSKTALDEFGKTYVATIKAKSKVVDTVRSDMRKSLESLAHEVRKPVTDFENAEKIKKKAIEDKMAQLENLSFLADGEGVEGLKKLINEARNFVVDESFLQFKESAEILKESTIQELTEELEKAEKLEKDQKELAELREEKRLKVEKEEKEAAEKLIADKARIEAEQKAEKEKQEQAEKVEAEKRKEQDEKDEAIRAKIAAEEKLKMETAKAEKAEADKIEAAKQAQIDKEEAIKATELRVKKEQEAEKEKIVAAEIKREANVNHHKKINNEILEDILKIGGVHEYNAKEIIKEIALGRIRNLRIQY